MIRRLLSRERRPLPVVVYVPRPLVAPTRVRIDGRTPEQRLEDQARFDTHGLPRGMWAA